MLKFRTKASSLNFYFKFHAAVIQGLHWSLRRGCPANLSYDVGAD